MYEREYGCRELGVFEENQRCSAPERDRMTIGLWRERRSNPLSAVHRQLEGH
jgi:hypothetical protein